MTAEERFEKIEEGIRDLIVVSRTVLNSIEQLGGSVNVMRDSIEKLREGQARTDAKVNSFDEMFNALIQAQRESEAKVSRLADIVDKLTRYRGPNGQSDA
jgi:chromosome segregation ATPase